MLMCAAVVDERGPGETSCSSFVTAGCEESARVLRCLATTWAHECGLYGERWSSALTEGLSAYPRTADSRIFVWTVQRALLTDPAACQAAFALVTAATFFGGCLCVHADEG